MLEFDQKADTRQRTRKRRDEERKREKERKDYLICVRRVDGKQGSENGIPEDEIFFSGLL